MMKPSAMPIEAYFSRSKITTEARRARRRNVWTGFTGFTRLGNQFRRIPNGKYPVDPVHPVKKWIVFLPDLRVSVVNSIRRVFSSCA
jgi:hypothetical protein